MGKKPKVVHQYTDAGMINDLQMSVSKAKEQDIHAFYISLKQMIPELNQISEREGLKIARDKWDRMPQQQKN